MITVYHVAAMGDWQEVCLEQLAMLSRVGINRMDVTFLGENPLWFLDQADHHGIRTNLVYDDSNLHHCETKAMQHIDYLAKTLKEQEPILYFHTKGVSAPRNPDKRRWRKLMEECVIECWENNLRYLVDHDCVGCNWIDWPGGHPHFSGNFWIARSDWLRKLPDFVEWHHALNCVRYSCEFWIGATPGCRPMSHRYSNEPFWECPFRW